MGGVAPWKAGEVNIVDFVKSKAEVQETRAERDEGGIKILVSKVFLLLQPKTLEILWPSLLFIHVWRTHMCKYMCVEP